MPALRASRSAVAGPGGIAVVSENSTHVVVVVSDTVVHDDRISGISVSGVGAKVVSSRNAISGEASGS